MPHPPPTRSTIRKWVIRCLFSVVGAVALGMVVQFFVQVAIDKGYYADAGKRWDGAMSAVLNILTSPVAINLAAFSLGAALGLILDWRAFRPKGEPIAVPLVPSEDASSALLVVEFQKGGSVREMRSENIFTWRGEVQIAHSIGEDGKTISLDALGHWFFAVWFEKPIFDYVATARPIGQEHIMSAITWQSERGLVFNTSAPQEPIVLELRIEKREHG